jgi:hypothetical protein
MVECDCHGAVGKDKVRSDIKEDVVVDAANTLSNKGRRGGINNDNNYGGKGGNMDNVVGVVAVLYVSKEKDGGSLIVAAPEGRTTIGLTMRRICWWMLTLRRMWWWMRLTLCLTRAEEEATTTTKSMGARGAIWTMLMWWLYCMFPRKRMGGV